MANTNISIRLETYDKLKTLKQIRKLTNYSDLINALITEASLNKSELDITLKEQIKKIVEDVIEEKKNY